MVLKEPRDLLDPVDLGAGALARLQAQRELLGLLILGALAVDLGCLAQVATVDPVL